MRGPKPDPALTPAPESMHDHVLMVGYSYVGRAICLMLEWAQIPYICFEIDLARIALARSWKHKVDYGDATDPILLGLVRLARARSMIVTTGIYDSTKRIISNLRQFYPDVPVMTAVQYLAQREELRQIGATQVVALGPRGHAQPSGVPSSSRWACLTVKSGQLSTRSRPTTTQCYAAREP